jgi:Tol biopolymer transport system component
MNFKIIFSLLLVLSIFVLEVKFQTKNPQTKIVFAVIEGKNVNVYSSELNGDEKKLLLTDEIESFNTPADQAVYMAISPRGDSIAYTLPKNARYVPLYLMNADGSNKQKIAEKAIYFRWSPDGKRILYSLLGRDQPKERSFYPFGEEWHILDLKTGKDEVIAVGREGFQGIWSWKQEDRPVFYGSSFGQTWLFNYDLKTKRSRSTRMTWRNKTLTNFEAGFSPSERRRVLALWTCCVELTFDIFELSANNRRVKRLVRSPGTIYTPGIKWNGEDEFFFVKATGIDGQPPVTTRTNEYGFYALDSIYKYSFKTRRTEKVVEGRANRTYRLKDVIQGKGLLVTSLAPKQTPVYALEFRKLDGTQPKTIYTSDKAISYIGQIKGNN